MEEGRLQVAPPFGLPPELKARWERVGKLSLELFHELYDDDEKDLAYDLLKPFAADWIYTTAGNIEVLGYTLPEAVERDYHLPCSQTANCWRLKKPATLKPMAAYQPAAFIQATKI